MASRMMVAAGISVVLMFSRAAHAQGSAGAPAISLKGYDVVAYFTDGRPVKGSMSYAHDWDGARYHFAGAKHRAAFIAEPERYAPQFSGLCAMGVSVGKRLEADPSLFKIVDGKLYVFSSAKGRAMAESDPALLSRSRESWQKLK